MKKFLSFVAGALVTASAVNAACPPKVIAHRGYWETAGSAQNSIRSLVKADSVKCYASEFDVWMTADSVLVVNHDAKFKGANMHKDRASKICAVKLDNGENLPTLEEYLKAAQKLPVRLVLEMKTHDSRARDKRAVKAIVDMVKKYGLQDRTDYITFSKEGFQNFIKFAPKGTEVYYLTGDYIPAQVKEMGGAGIDYSLKALKAHPEWIRQAQDLGMKVNVWTVNEKDDMQWCIDRGVDFITTNFPEQSQELIELNGPCKCKTACPLESKDAKSKKKKGKK